MRGKTLIHSWDLSAWHEIEGNLANQSNTIQPTTMVCNMNNSGTLKRKMEKKST